MGAPSPPAAGAGTVDLSRWPLVGRDDELALARSALTEHGSVLVTGAAGVGKTRLAHEVLAGAAAEGDRTKWVRATQVAATVPLGAVAHMIPGAAVGRSRAATLRAIVSALEPERGERRLLLGVDDAHLLDDASAALVHLLVTSGTASAVVTLRSGETAPDSIVALWKDGPAPLIALQALARPEVEEVVTTVLGGLVEGATLHFLWESSRGNSLFLRELVRDGLESGALRCEQGLWRWHGRLEPGERLHDLVAMRMGRLEEDERAALELLAVGEPLPLDRLRALRSLDVVARLERRGLVTSSDDDRRELRLAHPLFGEVLRPGIPASRLDEMRRQLADTLSVGGELDARDAVRVGLWRADAGDASRPDQLLAATRRAWSLGAAPVAERLARAVLSADLDLEAGYLLGEALSDQGRAQEALDAWGAVEHLPGPDMIRARLALAHASLLVFQLDRPDEAEAIMRRASDEIEDEAARRFFAGTAAVVATTHPSAPRLPADRAPLPDVALTDASTLHPALAAVNQATATGAFEYAIRTAAEAMVVAEEFADEWPTVGILLRMDRAWALALHGDIGAAEADADQAYAEAVGDGADQPRARWCLVQGMLAVLRGRPRRAIAALREATAVLETADIGFLRPTRAYLAMALALVGDTTAAQDAWRGADAAARSLDRILGVEVTRAGGWIHAAAGETNAALRVADTAATEAAAGGQWMMEALAHHDAARFGGAGDAVERLDELAGVVDGPLVDALAAHAGALTADDGAALDAVSTTFAGLGFDLFGAEASAAAPAAHRRVGKKASALAAARRARDLAERCEGARTPALARADQPDELTTREQEVADLAASGLASKEIAGQLGIKTRTVDNLLGRVYTKLGVSGRQDLAELLGSRAERPGA